MIFVPGVFFNYDGVECVVLEVEYKPAINWVWFIQSDGSGIEVGKDMEDMHRLFREGFITKV